MDVFSPGFESDDFFVGWFTQASSRRTNREKRPLKNGECAIAISRATSELAQLIIASRMPFVASLILTSTELFFR